METERLEQGFYVKRSDSPGETVVARQLFLGDTDSIENYEVVSEEEGLELTRQRDEAREAEMQAIMLGEKPGN